MTVYTQNHEGFNFICLADEEVRVDSAYAFLETVKSRFFAKYTIEQARGAVGGISFKDELQKLVEEGGSSPDMDKAKAVISQLTEVKDLTADNLSNRSELF